MARKAQLLLAMVAVLGLFETGAQAGIGWSIGLNFGPPPPPRPRPYYYRPYPVIVEPAPVIVRPRAVYEAVPVVQQPVYQVPAASASSPAAETTQSQAPPLAKTESPAQIDSHLQQLSSPDERVRAEVVLHLGRLKAERAVDPLAATLAGDASPAVREAAARALGLIGSPRALPALHRAAQADNDRDVRNSARFAVEVIQSGR